MFLSLAEDGGCRERSKGAGGYVIEASVLLDFAKKKKKNMNNKFNSERGVVSLRVTQVYHCHWPIFIEYISSIGQ